MASIQMGTATVWALPTISSIQTGLTTTAATAATARSLLVTSLSVSKSRQIDETMNADGDVAAVVMYGKAEEVTIECLPCGSVSSNTVATAESANALPEIGDVLKFTTPSATEEADIAATLESAVYIGYWTVIAASKNRINATKASWSLTLKRWGGISVPSQLS